jgi:hypothetical protein
MQRQAAAHEKHEQGGFDRPQQHSSNEIAGRSNTPR